MYIVTFLICFLKLYWLCPQGSARRKKKVIHRTATTDDKKLQSSLKKLSVNPIPGIEEVSCKYFRPKKKYVCLRLPDPPKFSGSKKKFRVGKISWGHKISCGRVSRGSFARWGRLPLTPHRPARSFMIAVWLIEKTRIRIRAIGAIHYVIMTS